MSKWMMVLSLVVFSLSGCGKKDDTAKSVAQTDQAARFACGETSCLKGAEYCLVSVEGATPKAAKCLPMPATCDAGDCACASTDGQKQRKEKETDPDCKNAMYACSDVADQTVVSCTKRRLEFTPDAPAQPDDPFAIAE